MRRGWVVAIVAVAIGTASAAAQERRPYVGGGAMVSTQGSERPGESPSFPRSGVGGTALGLTAEAGAFLADAVSIAFEAGIPLRFESIQETDYFLVFRTRNRHRDLVFSGLFHFHLPAAGAMRAAIVAGPSVVREDTQRSIAYAIGAFGGVSSGNFAPFGVESPLTRWTVGVTGGADFAFQAARHVSVVPQIRIHRVSRAEQGEGDSGSLGLGSWIVRPAVTVRAVF
jgi:hypothetical protein